MPPLRTLHPAPHPAQAADDAEVCHWVEAHVAQVGWRGKLAYIREGWSNLNMESAKQRIRLRKKGGAGAAFAN